MAERLIIQNFAGLNVNIELGRINIFIGPQASGKSVCARCLYWFKLFFSELESSVLSEEGKRTFDASCLNTFREYFPNLWRTDTDFLLRYEVGEIIIEVAQTKKKLGLTYSPAIQTIAAELRVNLRRIREKHTLSTTGRLSRALAKKYDDERIQAYANWLSKLTFLIGESHAPSQAFVLAGRTIFSALKGVLLTFLSNNPVTDPMLRDFLRGYEYARQDQPTPDNPLLKSLSPLVESIMKGRFVAQEGDDLLVLADGRQVPLTYASSGQQEAFPLILFLLSYLDDYRKDEAGSHVLYVEEPEAHLYPDSQWAIVRLMAGVFNASLAASGSQLVITTHSPYLLSTFNNLIRAHQLAEQFKDSPKQLKSLNSIVPKGQQLALENFRVYALADGKAHSIISAEDGLIVADKLDEVSERISQQFDKLLHLEAQAAADEKAS